nr:MAG TPA: hypothetical protein [Caudoviricetes sp.]DAK65359.1 MAG TPA: hypothetical protein [Caudoviricetes sp.]DAP43043.1 MAG TPA: hypothetical protein [Caudoviricetes sp.]
MRYKCLAKYFCVMALSAHRQYRCYQAPLKY